MRSSMPFLSPVWRLYGTAKRAHSIRRALVVDVNLDEPCIQGRTRPHEKRCSTKPAYLRVASSAMHTQVVDAQLMTSR